MCVSNYIRKQTRKYLNLDEDAENLVVVKNCIDIDKFDLNLKEEEKKEIKKQYGLGEYEKVIIFSGRLTKEKGIIQLFEAIKNIRFENYKVLIVGSFFFETKIKNSFSEELSEKIKKSKEKIIFTGYVQYSDIPKLYNIADIAVLPSIWDEPAGLTIIESMASGLPIITTNSGGIPEYANNDCTIILEKNDKLVENLTFEMEKILNNNQLQNEMSKLSKINAKKYNLNNLYCNILKEMGINIE